jgi:hypothetical protein
MTLFKMTRCSLGRRTPVKIRAMPRRITTRRTIIAPQMDGSVSVSSKVEYREFLPKKSAPRRFCFPIFWTHPTFVATKNILQAATSLRHALCTLVPPVSIPNANVIRCLCHDALVCPENDFF